MRVITKICSFMLMVIVFTQHVRSLALTAHHTKQSLSLAHRCCNRYNVPYFMMLFSHHRATLFLLCVGHHFTQSLCFVRRSYFERSQDILCLYSVFFTMPCIFWHYFHHREFCCILYNNSSILSSLTANLMC